MMDMHQEVNKDKQSLGWGGRLFLTIFGLAFFVTGSFVTYTTFKDMYETAITRFWTKTECTIVSSEVKKLGNKYNLEIFYKYLFRSREYTGTRYSVNYKGSEDYSEAQRLSLRYPRGAESTCYVNSRSPRQSVLAHEPIWEGIFGLFSLIFVAVGLFVLAFAWYPGRKSDDNIQAKSISDKGKPKFGWHWLGFLFFGAFVIVGLAIFTGNSFEPLYKSLDALSWQRTPCIIEESKVLRNKDSDGDSVYKPNILYSYNINGVQYRSNRYSYATISSGDPGRAKGIVRRYPVGGEEYCYVNSNDPTEAVLNRDWTIRHLFHFLPLIFTLAGLVGVIATWQSLRKRKQAILALVGPRYAPGASVDQSVIPAMKKESGAVTLKPHTSTWTQIGGLIFMAFFWNGLVSVFVWKVITSWMEGDPEYFLTVFIIPFVVVGLGLIVGMVYTVLKLFSPRVTLIMSQPSVRLGGSFNLTWRIPRVRAIDHLEITVQGREQSQYTRGTDTYTDKEMFLSIPVLSSFFEMDMVGGSRLITIPSDSVPSFNAENNKIIWSIHVKGDIKGWPNIDNEYEIPVLPLEHTNVG